MATSRPESERVVVVNGLRLAWLAPNLAPMYALEYAAASDDDERSPAAEQPVPLKSGDARQDVSPAFDVMGS